MKNFLKFVLSLVIALVFFVLVVFCFAESDEYYSRFTSPKQSSLILGTSKAAQGIHPEILNKVLGKKVYNYSFTIAHSPFGPAYLKSIKKKLNGDTNNGVFIVTIDPWSISENEKLLGQPSKFREHDKHINLECVTCNPNISYFIKYYQKPYYHLLVSNNAINLHDDGWLEINVPMDSSTRAFRRTKVLNDYSSTYSLNYKLSPIRLNYLHKTIKFLQTHGRVYLVRLPVHPDMYEIENNYMPGLNDLIANKFPEVKYLDLSAQNHQFKYVDGIHLDVKSGDFITTEIANWIKNN